MDVGGKNRITTAGYAYDPAGNMTSDGLGHSYTYDQENRITGAAGYRYVYDADGNRVEKANGTTPASGTLYWYMSPGIVAESDLAGALKSEYVFFGGERVARRDLVTPTGVFYYYSDHLKTASVITDSAGIIKAESDYYPWGGELKFVDADPNHYKFTGKERDSESGLDYFGARYYGNTLGRFLTPDWAAKPVAMPYAILADPQSLNLYTYVRNIPTTQIDADGHETLKPGDWSEKYDSKPTEFDHQMSQALLNGFSLVTGAAGRAFMAVDAVLDLRSGNTKAGVLGLVAALPMGRIAGSVWNLGAVVRGAAIERMLGANLPRTFPVIDKFLNGVATSIKSMDLTAKTYQNAEALASKINGYVDKLAGFKGAQLGQAGVKASEITSRELQLAVPAGSMTDAQRSVINAVTQRAASLKRPSQDNGNRNQMKPWRIRALGISC